MRGSNLKTPYFIVILIALVLSLGSVTALGEDFAAFASSETINACACDLTTDSITIRNDGDVTSTFMLDVGGDAAEWVNIAPQTFYLEPGQEKRVERFINLPCSAREEYTLNTTINTLFDIEKSLQQTLIVENCQNVQVVPQFSGAQQECPCTPVEYSFEVINTGKHMETYQLSVEPFSDAISMSTDFLVLAPGESEFVSVFINLECGQYGERIFTFNAFAEGTGMLGQTDFQLNIDKCYDYNLTVGEEYGVCGGVPNIIPFDITNSADIANEYVLAVIGPEWAYPENDTLAAWGGETVSSNIVVVPPNEAEYIEIINLNAFSVRGQEGRSAEILLETELCHDYTLVPSVDAFKSVDCDDKDHVFYLTNVGSRETEYYVEVEGIEGITGPDEPIVLGPGESTEVIISGESPCGMYGDFLENVYVTMADINQTYLEEKIFSIYPKEEAYIPEIQLKDMNIGYDGGDAEIIISNAGFESVTYGLDLIASDWLDLSADEVTLAPGENATVLIIATPTEDVPEDIYLAELLVSLPDNSVEYSTEFLVELDEEGGSIWIAVIASSGLIILILILLLVWFIVRRNRKRISPGEPVIKAIEKSEPVNNYMTIKKRKYLREEVEEKNIRIWPIIFVALLVLMLVSGAYFILTSGLFAEDVELLEDVADSDVIVDVTGSDGADMITEEDISEALVTLDLTRFQGEGNTIEIEDGTVIHIPVKVHNPTDMKARLSLSSEDIWVDFDKDVLSVAAGSEAETELIITPDITSLEEARLIIFDVNLEGKKIDYDENIEFILAMRSGHDGLSRLWFWLMVFVVALAILILLMKSLRKDSGEKKGSRQYKAEKIVKPDMVNKEKTEKRIRSKINKDRGWAKLIGIILMIVGIVLIISILGIVAYKNIVSDDGQDVADEELDVASDLVEEIPQDLSGSSDDAGNADIVIEKMTEDDVEEPLITIDRSGIPGKGNVFKLDREQYIIPISVQNPTDRKARFAVNVKDDSWISFDRYVILVQPESTNTVDMMLTPDMSVLDKLDYSVTVETKLEGRKIDYSEDLEFILTDKKSLFEFLWLYLLLLILVIGIAFAGMQIKKEHIKDKSKRKNSRKKFKDVDAINDEISELRKKTGVSLKR